MSTSGRFVGSISTASIANLFFIKGLWYINKRNSNRKIIKAEIRKDRSTIAWEKRGKGRYYYRKYRDGSKVKSEYVGAGVIGEMAEKLDLEERQQKDQQAKQEREQIETMREYFDSIESIMDPVEDKIKALTKAF